MIKNGVYLLKKRNSVFQKINLFFLFCIVLVLAASCKSVSVARNVNAVELLDDKSAFYIAIPSSADSKLIERIIKNNVPAVSDSNAKFICEKISKVYCGINRSKNNTEFQCVVDGNIPVNMMPKILSKKNGWTNSIFIPQNSVNQYKIFNISKDSLNLDIAFPSQNTVCIGRDVKNMIDRYDFLHNLPAENSVLDTQIEKSLAEYLLGAEDEIRFFANKPQSFLTVLLGVKLDLKLNEVKGAFMQDSKHENQYLLNLHFNFKNEKYLKAGRTLLTLAFGLTNSNSVVTGTNILEINGIKIDKNQLYRLLVL